MKNLLFLAMALLALAANSFGDVASGDKYKCGSNGTITVTCTLVPTANEVNVNITAPNGDVSPDVTGTPGDAGGDTCSGSPSMSADGITFRVEQGTGNPQYKNSNGDWIDCGVPRKKIGQNDPSYLTPLPVFWPDEEVSSLPMTNDVRRPRIRTAVRL